MARRPLRFDPIDEARSQWDRRWVGSTEMAAATSIMRAQQIVLGAVDRALKPFDLTFARYEALVLLHFTRAGSLPLGKMGARLMIHPTSVTNIVDRLERDRLVRRLAHPTDRRTTLAEITAEGRSVVLVATQAVVDARFGLASLAQSELEHLTTLLGRLRLSAGDFRQ